MTGKARAGPFRVGWAGFRRLGPVLDQPNDILVVQSRFGCPFAIPRGVDKERPEVDLSKMQQLFECVHGAGMVLRATANLDFASSGLGVQCQ